MPVRFGKGGSRWMFLVLLALAAVALALSAAAGAAERPKIGVAFGGGGARGAAHVGVLKVLEEQRIPIDYIAGTSMGAIIGGLYASGMSPEEIERGLVALPWEGVFNDRVPRAERRFRRKQDDYTYLIPRKLGVKEDEGEVNLPPALIQGQKFDLELRKLLLPVAGVTDFDRLRIPYRAVATDIVSGGAVALDSGDLATAIRASMAVPAIFSPVEIGDRLLVDGGVAMNLPISVVREMGADIVIAIDLTSPARKREDIKSALDMVKQLSELLTRRGTEAQIATLKKRDLLIVPALGNQVSSSAFQTEKLLEAVAIGEASAKDRLSSLRPLGLSRRSYAAYRKRTVPVTSTPARIDYVRVENESRLSDETITRRIGIRAGDRLDVEKIERSIGKIYDQDNFESVRYRLEQRDGKNGVVITAQEKSWGTSAIQLGLELGSVSSDASLFNLGGAYTMMPVNDLNAEWRTFFRIGEEGLLFTELYQPLDPQEEWFVNVGGGYIQQKIKLFEDSAVDEPTGEYDIDKFGVAVAAGKNLGDWGRLSARYRRFTGEVEAITGDPGLDGEEFETGDLTLKLSIDTLDHVTFSTLGWRGGAYWRMSRDALGADTDFDQAGLSVFRAGSFGRHRFNGLLQFDTTLDDDAPVQDLFRLGGFGRLSGYNQNQLSGQHAALLRAGYFYDLQTSLIDTYVGGTLEAGNVWQSRDDMEFDDLIFAGSVFVGADTPLGPLSLSYGHAEGGHSAVYFSLGKPWINF